MKVAVSACLLGVRCRFDGRSKPSAEVQCFLEGHECQVVKICPEVMGGLSIPHPPHEQRVLDGQVRVVDAEGNDHTEAFEAAGLRVGLHPCHLEGEKPFMWRWGSV